jgi:hypothetical protein
MKPQQPGSRAEVLIPARQGRDKVLNRPKVGRNIPAPELNSCFFEALL